MLWDRFSGCPTLTPPYHRVPPLESADLATATDATDGPRGSEPGRGSNEQLYGQKYWGRLGLCGQAPRIASHFAFYGVI